MFFLAVGRGQGTDVAAGRGPGGSRDRVPAASRDNQNVLPLFMCINVK